VSEVLLRLDGGEVLCEVSRAGEDWVVRIGSRTVRFRLAALEPGVAAVEVGGRTHLARWAVAGAETYLHLDGVTAAYEVARNGAQRGRGDASDGNDLRAPMPGSVTQVHVHRGDTVTRGQPLLVVEAMKMEHVIRAPRAGTVRAVHVRVGQRVEGGAVVAEIGAPGGDPPPSP